MNLKNKIKQKLGIKKKYIPKPIEDLKSLQDVALYLIDKYNLKKLYFLEIGVFKADNVLSLIREIKSYYKTEINYTGFDLFDDIQYLEQNYPEDYKQYDLADFPYWEFSSGGHNYVEVMKKLSKELKKSDFELIKGDTLETLKSYIDNGKMTSVDLIYIDGCHDYEVVKHDWANCETGFNVNPHLIIVFDDFTYEGVKTVYKLIEDSLKYKIIHINSNQFLVTLNLI